MAKPHKVWKWYFDLFPFRHGKFLVKKCSIFPVVPTLLLLLLFGKYSLTVCVFILCQQNLSLQFIPTRATATVRHKEVRNNSRHQAGHKLMLISSTIRGSPGRNQWLANKKSKNREGRLLRAQWQLEGGTKQTIKRCLLVSL